MTPRSLLAEILLTRLPARVLMFVLSLVAALFGLLAPLFQREFLSVLMPGTPAPEGFHMILGGHHPLVVLGCAFAALMFSLIFTQSVWFLGARESFLIQRRLSQRLYDSTLQLRSESLKGRPIGEIVSVYTTDIPGATILLEQSLPQGLSIFFPLVLAPLILITEFGIPVSAVAIVLTVLLLQNFYMAHKQSRYFFLFKTLAAERVGIVNEWIQNIRTLRVLSWIDEFEQRIFKVRIRETANRVAMMNNGQGMNAISSSVTYLLNALIIIYLSFVAEKPMQPAGLLTLLWIVAVFLTRPFRQLPWFFTFLFDAWTSIKRLHATLSLQEDQARQLFHRNRQLLADARKLPIATALNVSNLSYRAGNTSILENISFSITPGEFVAIVGEVGSGKTALLLALMRENSSTFGEFTLDGIDAQKLNDESLRRYFSFVPQEGFIMSSSLKENVLLDYSNSKLAIASLDSTQELSASAALAESDSLVLASLIKADFDPTHEGLNSGLATEIGERGVNLSGGQRQRIGLSRVEVRDAPIMLLDDCLSAVDVHTERRLLHNLLKGSWQKRTRLLVTHRLTVLKEVDRILFLSGGRLVDVGSFEQIYSRNAEFRDFTASLSKPTKEARGQQ